MYPIYRRLKTGGAAVKTSGSAGGASSDTFASWEKNRKIAALLAFLLGGIGAHKFYMGSWGWAIVYAVVSIGAVSAEFPELLFAIGVLLIVEAIMYIRMTDEAFAEKYPLKTQAPFRW
jgi:TM2 domain-containing membrane protein YozV